MTDFKVKVVKINDVFKHPNADKLSICQIDGWQCVTQLDAYKPGDLAIYFPIDSILPETIEAVLFGPDAKIKLNKSRVRTIKIRQVVSQGMLASCDDFGIKPKEGLDVTSMLGITKFEPPEPPASMRGGNQVSKKKKNSHFKEYGGLDNFKHHNRLFQDGEEVVITEKVHGTNFRCGLLPVEVNTFWKKVKKFFRVLPSHEFVFGSNKVQLQDKKAAKTGYYEKQGVGNVYEEAVIKYDMKNKFEKGEVVYGEIYGDGIQKNYAYGCKQGEHKLVIFDLMRNGEYISHDELVEWCKDRELDMVPVLYRGPFSEAKARELTKGNSVFVPSQKVREGVVIRSPLETKCSIGRKVLKLISDDYLLKEDNTDFH